MQSEGGARGSWTSQEAFQEIDSLLDGLAAEDLTLLSAESMGDDQMALQRIGNLALLCGRHHYRTHEQGLRLEWGAGGELVVIPP